MIRYSSEVTIDRSPGEVLDALLDPKLYSQWTNMVDVRFDDMTAMRVGTTGSFRLATGEIKGPLQMTVTEIDRDRRLVVEVTHPNLDWTSVSTLVPEGRGTRLTYAGEISLKGWRRVLEPVMAREVTAGEAKEAERLKALLESERSVPAGEPTPA
jgi:uncharacterized protein YndB with AHSA1/START domain